MAWTVTCTLVGLGKGDCYWVRATWSLKSPGYWQDFLDGSHEAMDRFIAKAEAERAKTKGHEIMDEDKVAAYIEGKLNAKHVPQVPEPPEHDENTPSEFWGFKATLDDELGTQMGSGAWW